MPSAGPQRPPPALRLPPPRLRSAERNGFVREGVPRSSAWVMGEFLDEVLLGLLAQEWKPDSKS